MPRKYNKHNGDTMGENDDLLNSVFQTPPNIQSSSSIQLPGMPLIVCVPSNYLPMCVDDIAQVTPIPAANMSALRNTLRDDQMTTPMCADF